MLRPLHQHAPRSNSKPTTIAATIVVIDVLNNITTAAITATVTAAMATSVGTEELRPFPKMIQYIQRVTIYSKFMTDASKHSLIERHEMSQGFMERDLKGGKAD